MAYNQGYGADNAPYPLEVPEPQRFYPPSTSPQPRALFEYPPSPPPYTPYPVTNSPHPSTPQPRAIFDYVPPPLPNSYNNYEYGNRSPAPPQTPVYGGQYQYKPKRKVLPRATKLMNRRW